MSTEFLRTFVALNDPDSLGLDVHRIGLHSLQATAAMAMYLSHVPVFTIMLVGCWRALPFSATFASKSTYLSMASPLACLPSTSSQRGDSARAIPDQTEERTLDALVGQAIPYMGSNVAGPIAFDIWRA